MVMKKIVIADQDHIDDYSEIAADFLKKILNLNINECLITDETELSDFSLCNMDPEVSDNMQFTINQLYAIWDFDVLKKINEIYGINVKCVRTTLIDIFYQIYESKKQMRN